MSDRFRIFVRGEPKSKGSMRAFVVKGRPIITADNPKTRSWERLLADRISSEWESEPWDGPIDMELTFQILRPKSAKKRLWPHVKPDLSKLIRAVEDALVGAGALKDDALIVSCACQKIYADMPGVEIELRKL